MQYVQPRQNIVGDNDYGVFMIMTMVVTNKDWETPAVLLFVCLFVC